MLEHPVKLKVLVPAWGSENLLANPLAINGTGQSAGKTQIYDETKHKC